MYFFRVSPAYDKVAGLNPERGMCYGELYMRDTKGWNLKWKRHLINNVAPCAAHVSNSGQYVITISEWAETDLLPLVFYGNYGQLINTYGNLD
jgi:hypothetical protein